jgi:hypothetical protein
MRSRTVTSFSDEFQPLFRHSLFFEDEQADRSTWQSFKQIKKGHGRLERRQILEPLNPTPRQ